MFWKKSKETDFERAADAYYKYCKRKRIVPVKPSAQYSEIGDSHIILRNQFTVIAKIFFVGKAHPSETKNTVAPSGSFVLDLQ
jgi:hypothetical protein